MGLLRGVVSAVAATLFLAAPAATSSAATAPAPPPVGAGVDYQLGGTYRAPADAGIVVRDRLDVPAPNRYSVCYINAFQTQPGMLWWWKRYHPKVLLRDSSGALVKDEAWGEVLFDISTAAKRYELGKVQSYWVRRCAIDGFDAIEGDNLDSWTRSGGRLTKEQAILHATNLTRRAHSVGLASAQKNTVELGRAGRDRVGFDFVITESCQRFSGSRPGTTECDDHMRVYGRRVIEIEYPDGGGWSAFRAACAARGSKISIVYRDLNLVTPSQRGYVRKTC